MEKEIIVQIFAGGFTGKSPGFARVEEKLEYITSRMKVSKVFIGWVFDPEMYEKTREYLHKRGIEFYLWLPVFSEVGALYESGQIVDYQGKQIENYQWQEDEDFTFYCPNQPINNFNVLRVFEDNFSRLGFDGVFLDKIRYSSFANGIKGVLTCFCPHCQIKYKAAGFDPTGIEGAIERLKSYSTPMGVTAYKQGKYSFDDEVWEQFFRLKSSFITQAVQALAQYFTERHYKVGLDVMAPFVSHFVGQDNVALSSFTNFLKPMMYRVTKAPAGLPFELDAIVKRTNATEAQQNAFYELIGYDPHKDPFDLSFTEKELRGLASEAHNAIYPGVEINYIKEIAESTPAYLEETMQAYGQAGAKGFVLSWNILEAPNENIDKVISMFSNV